MDKLSVIIGISGIVILILNVINYRYARFGSDHYFHLNIIQLIKKNRHRFISRYTNFIGNEYIAYPQLFHWILSFLNVNNPARVNFFYKSFIFFLDVLCFFLFFHTDLLKFSSRFSELHIFLYAALLLLFTPFNYVRWNAANAGFSARSLGLFLGRLFVYLFVYYLYHPHYYLIGIIIFVAYLILISSQFAAQYIIFLCVIYAITTLNALVLLIPVVAFGLFYGLHRQIALNYIRGQYQHKKVYAGYFAKRGILKYRPGIWQDFIYDFWIKLKRQGVRAFPYIQYNSVVTVFWGFTILPILLYFLAQVTFVHNKSSLMGFIGMIPLFQVVLASLLIFLLTSFAATRFLGEPERYLEFATPAMIFLFIQFLGNTIIYYTLIYYVLASLGLMLINIVFNKKYESRENSILQAINDQGFGQPSLVDTLYRLKEEKGPLRLFSNNEEVVRRMVGEDFLFLLPDAAAEKTGSFYYKDIYHAKYPFVNEALLLPMVKEFEINIFIADTRNLSLPVEALFSTLTTQTCYTFHYFVLIYIEKQTGQ